jgi:hypothetical protein
MKKILMFCLLSAVTSNVFAATTLTEAFATGTTVKFTTKLSEKLPTGYKVKINLNNGKGLIAMTCSGLTCLLSSNFLPKVDTSIYKVGIYDAKGVLQGATTNGSYVIVSTAVTTGYTKISNAGATLPDTAILGSGANDWACTRDNKTGLVWEVKTDDGGLRDMSQKYTNLISGETGYGVNSNSDYFSSSVNKQTLCGASNWRIPTSEELNGLVSCSDSQYTKISLNTGGNTCINKYAVAQPTINATFFPNTQNLSYWTSSLFLNNKNGGYYLNFNGEGLISSNRSSSLYIRLVHDEKPITGNISNAIVDQAVVAYLTTQKTAADKTAIDYLTTLKTTAEKTATDYLMDLKSTADKTVADYLTKQKTSADKTAADYLTTQKLTADMTAADYLAKLKAAADNTFPPVASLGSYSKISNSGMSLPDSANLGSGSNDWACTKDNKTGLTWEVKTKDGGFRDKDLTYSNYFQNGISPVQDKNNYGLSGNSDVFVKDVNKQSLCGSADWRLPTKNEMDTLIYCSENACKYAYVTINTVYFPNTHGSEYWTSTTSQGYFTIPFFVYFGSDGYSGGGDMASKYYIRLVR